MHFAGTLTLFDIALNTWDRAAVIYPLCAISSVIWNMVHYDRKDSAAIAKAMGGFESNDAALRAMVGAVHAMSGLGGDAPKVYIIPSDEPNAFAAGTKASVVAVTTGLLELLSPRELRAVLAHEIGHVRNRDMARSLGAGCMVAGLGFAMTIGDYLVQSERSDRRRSRGKKSKNDKKDDGGLGSLGLILYASGAITQAMGTLLRMMHSRTAEYAADAFAKSIGAGADLASALEKLEASHAKVTKRDEKTLGLAANAFAASYIDNPPERDSWLLTMGGWLRTHPRNQDRIERLLD
jgi:heat shock protein HtpX